MLNDETLNENYREIEEIIERKLTLEEVRRFSILMNYLYDTGYDEFELVHECVCEHD